MRTGLTAAKERWRSHLRDALDAVARGRRSRNRRACVTCGAVYVGAQGVYPDPRCPRCATWLAAGGDRDAELGAGD